MEKKTKRFDNWPDDPKKVEAIYRTFVLPGEKYLKSVALHYANGDSALAADFFSEAVLDIICAAHNFDERKGTSASHFAYGVAKRTMLKCAKTVFTSKTKEAIKRKMNSEQSRASHSRSVDDPLSILLHKEQSRIVQTPGFLQNLMKEARLSQSEAKAILAISKKQEGQTIETLALASGFKSEANFRSRLANARKKLWRAFERKTGEKPIKKRTPKKRLMFRRK